MEEIREIPSESAFRKSWKWFKQLDNFIKVYLVTMLLILLAIPIAISQKTNLSSRATSSNLLQNESFENYDSAVFANWNLRTQEPASGTITQDAAEKQDGSSSAKIDIADTASSSADAVQLEYTGINLAPTDYSLSFWVKADKERDIGTVMQQSDAPYNIYFQQSISASRDWTQKTINFTMTVPDTNAAIRFNLAQTTGSVWMDKVVLIQMSPIVSEITPTIQPEQNIGTPITEKQALIPTQTEKPTCVDSDSGKNFDTKGIVSGGSYGTIGYNHNPFTDYCNTYTPNQLIEYFCLGDSVQYNSYICPNSCSNGACVQTPAPPIATCSDSDNGFTLYERGAATGTTSGGELKNNISDSCIALGGKTYLNEWTCDTDKSKLYSYYYDCPYGCNNGACLCSPPYHELLSSQDSCQWICGAGTTPSATTNECVCQTGYTETGKDSLGRRICGNQ